MSPGSSPRTSPIGSPDLSKTSISYESMARHMPGAGDRRWRKISPSSSDDDLVSQGATLARLSTRIPYLVDIKPLDQVKVSHLTAVQAGVIFYSIDSESSVSSASGVVATGDTKEKITLWLGRDRHSGLLTSLCSSYIPGVDHNLIDIVARAACEASLQCINLDHHDPKLRSSVTVFSAIQVITFYNYSINQTTLDQFNKRLSAHSQLSELIPCSLEQLLANCETKQGIVRPLAMTVNRLCNTNPVACVTPEQRLARLRQELIDACQPVVSTAKSPSSSSQTELLPAAAQLAPGDWSSRIDQSQSPLSVSSGRRSLSMSSSSTQPSPIIVGQASGQVSNEPSPEEWRLPPSWSAVIQGHVKLPVPSQGEQKVLMSKDRASDEPTSGTLSTSSAEDSPTIASYLSTGAAKLLWASNWDVKPS